MISVDVVGEIEILSNVKGKSSTANLHANVIIGGSSIIGKLHTDTLATYRAPVEKFACLLSQRLR